MYRVELYAEVRRSVYVEGLSECEKSDVQRFLSASNLELSGESVRDLRTSPSRCIRLYGHDEQRVTTMRSLRPSWQFSLELRPKGSVPPQAVTAGKG